MKNNTMYLVLGILCLGAGLFLIGQAVSVSTYGGYFRIGSFSMPSGLTVVPLLVGITMLFFNHRSNLWKAVTGMGVVLILLAVIMSIRITMPRLSLFDFVMTFGLTFAGAGLLLRYHFGK